MTNAKKSYELWEISSDKQKLIRLSQMSDSAGLEQHIQTIEVKYFYYLFHFSLPYTKTANRVNSVKRIIENAKDKFALEKIRDLSKIVMTHSTAKELTNFLLKKYY